MANVIDPELMDEGLRLDMPLAKIHQSDDNPRFITDEALDRLMYALEKDPAMLNARPVIVTPYGEIICGNMRWVAAKRLGWQTIPTFVHHFASEAEKREWMLRDNQEYGDWVPDQLAQMIADHVAEGADTKLLGFDDDAVMAAVRRATGDAIVPEATEPPKQTLTSEVLVEIRCTSEALQDIEDTLMSWNEVDGIEVGISQ